MAAPLKTPDNMTDCPDGDNIRAILDASHPAPFAYLGPQRGAKGERIIRAFQPDADKAWVVDGYTGDVLQSMTLLDKDGLFVADFADKDIPVAYKLRFRRRGLGDQWESEDVYRFPSLLGECAKDLMTFDAPATLHERLGAQAVTVDGVDGVNFSLWAPGALRVALVGEFNNWDGRRHGMRHLEQAGVWEIFIPGLPTGSPYKFEIIGPDGLRLAPRQDPFARNQEKNQRQASLVFREEEAFAWTDDDWLAERTAKTTRSKMSLETADEEPVNIYWLHPAYWRRHPYEDGRLLSYPEIADELVAYLHDQSFTHVGLPPPQEQGLKPRGTGMPARQRGIYTLGDHVDDVAGFKSFVNACHRGGIGVVLDWGPWRRNGMEQILKRYDGTALYLKEQKPQRHGTVKEFAPEQVDRRATSYCHFDTDKRSVQNFLINNALFWLQEYHVDALCVDFEGFPSSHRSHDFLERLNQEIGELGIGAFAIGSENLYVDRASGVVIHSTDLGFKYSINRDWLRSIMAFMERPPTDRPGKSEDLIKRLKRLTVDDGVLPLVPDAFSTWDTIIGRMSGDDREGFASHRLLLTLTMAWPGKKLIFMGTEFAGKKPWDMDGELDWHLLIHPEHQGAQDLMKRLNTLYRSNKALSASGLGTVEWLDEEGLAKGLVAFLRRDREAASLAVAAFNFSNLHVYGYRLGVPVGGHYRVAVNTDATCWRGGEKGEDQLVEAKHSAVGRMAYSVRLSLPPNSGVILTPA